MAPDLVRTLRHLSVVIPTINEGPSIGLVMDELPRGLLEVIVVDGDSTDGTQQTARAKGARVISESRKGYGRALMTGLQSARGEFIATLDGDHTYPAEGVGEIAQVLIEKNLDFVTCDRLSTLDHAAMSSKHRFGNWVLSTATKILFKVPIVDSQSGMCVFRRSLLSELSLASTSFAFCQELKIEAFRRRPGRCAELPVMYRPRIGTPQLSSWRDGTANLTALLLKRLGVSKGRLGELYRPDEELPPRRPEPSFSAKSHPHAAADPRESL